MAKSTPNKYPVRLTDEQREEFGAITRKGKSPAAKVRKARVLLMADHGRPGGRMTDPAIADALGMHVNTVGRVRKNFALAGDAPSLDRKPRQAPPVPPKVDGGVEAHLVAICCSAAPEGRSRWTLKLLAKELVKRKLVPEVSAETVRLVLKKMNLNLGA